MTAHSDRPGYEPISSTLWRQREDYCARLIQGAWRRHSHPQPEVFGSILGSRSVLDAVLEEENDEFSDDDEDNIKPLQPTAAGIFPPSAGMAALATAVASAVASAGSQPATAASADASSTNHEGPAIVVHSRSSSVSSTSIV